MMKLLLPSMIFLVFGCFDSPKQELTQDEINARIEAKREAARKADSLLNSSRQIEEARNLSQAFAGIHVHGLGGSGNLAFDAHQDPEQTRRMIRSYAILAEKYKENAPRIEEARRKMIRNFQEAQEEENRRLY